MASHRGSILLVDEDLTARTALAEALRALQWRVETAPSESLGVDVAMKLQPDVVVSALPLHQFNYARTLRSCVEHDVVVVSVTANVAELRRRALEAGFDEVFAKPVDPGSLHTFLCTRLDSATDAMSAMRATTKMPKLRG